MLGVRGVSVEFCFICDAIRVSTHNYNLKKNETCALKIKLPAKTHLRKHSDGFQYISMAF